MNAPGAGTSPKISTPRSFRGDQITYPSRRAVQGIYPNPNAVFPARSTFWNEPERVMFRDSL
jgi:hypothetical protein